MDRTHFQEGKKKWANFSLTEKHIDMLTEIAQRTGTNNKSYVIRRLIEREYQGKKLEPLG